MKIEKEKLLKILADRGWTYADLAREMNVSRQFISNHIFISDRTNIRLATLFKFTKALGVEPNAILKEDTK